MALATVGVAGHRRRRLPAAIARGRRPPGGLLVRSALSWAPPPSSHAEPRQPHDLGSRRHRRATARSPDRDRRTSRIEPARRRSAPLRDGTDLSGRDRPRPARGPAHLAPDRRGGARAEEDRPQLLHHQLGRATRTTRSSEPACGSTIRRSSTIGPAASSWLDRASSPGSTPVTRHAARGRCVERGSDRPGPPQGLGQPRDVDPAADEHDRQPPPEGNGPRLQPGAREAHRRRRSSCRRTPIVVCSFGDASANHATALVGDQHGALRGAHGPADAAPARVRGQRHRHQRADAGWLDRVHVRRPCRICATSRRTASSTRCGSAVGDGHRSRPRRRASRPSCTCGRCGCGATPEAMPSRATDRFPRSRPSRRATRWRGMPGGSSTSARRRPTSSATWSARPGSASWRSPRRRHDGRASRRPTRSSRRWRHPTPSESAARAEAPRRHADERAGLVRRHRCPRRQRHAECPDAGRLPQRRPRRRAAAASRAARLRRGRRAQGRRVQRHERASEAVRSRARLRHPARRDEHPRHRPGSGAHRPPAASRRSSTSPIVHNALDQLRGEAAIAPVLQLRPVPQPDGRSRPGPRLPEGFRRPLPQRQQHRRPARHPRAGAGRARAWRRRGAHAPGRDRDGRRGRPRRRLPRADRALPREGSARRWRRRLAHRRIRRRPEHLLPGRRRPVRRDRCRRRRADRSATRTGFGSASRRRDASPKSTACARGSSTCAGSTRCRPRPSGRTPRRSATVLVVDECRATGGGVADAIVADLAEQRIGEPPRLGPSGRFVRAAGSRDERRAGRRGPGRGGRGCGRRPQPAAPRPPHEPARSSSSPAVGRTGRGRSARCRRRSPVGATRGRAARRVRPRAAVGDRRRRALRSGDPPAAVERVAPRSCCAACSTPSGSPTTTRSWPWPPARPAGTPRSLRRAPSASTTPSAFVQEMGTAADAPLREGSRAAEVIYPLTDDAWRPDDGLVERVSLGARRCGRRISRGRPRRLRDRRRHRCRDRRVRGDAASHHARTANLSPAPGCRRRVAHAAARDGGRRSGRAPRPAALGEAERHAHRRARLPLHAMVERPGRARLADAERPGLRHVRLRRGHRRGAARLCPRRRPAVGSRRIARRRLRSARRPRGLPRPANAQRSREHAGRPVTVAALASPMTERRDRAPRGRSTCRPRWPHLPTDEATERSASVAPRRGSPSTPRTGPPRCAWC